MKLVRAFGFLFLVVLAGCSGSNNDRRFVGAGLDLYTPQTTRETNDILDYLREMCVREGLVDCPGPGSYAMVLESGFNDITKRCNNYILWIDRQRVEAQMYNRGLASTQSLLAGLQPVINADANALAALLAIFSFAEDIYAIANLNVLAPFETSAIKLVIEKRLDAIRRTAEKHPPKSQSKVIEYLEDYLVQCTPTFIATNFNQDVRDPASGTPKALEDTFTQRHSGGATPPTRDADDLANSREPAIIVDPGCTACWEIYDEDLAGLTNDQAVEVSQTRLCMHDDGIVSTDTLAAIKIFEAALAGAPDVVQDGKLSELENVHLSNVGCRDDADRAKYRNVYEISQLEPDRGGSASLLQRIIGNLNRKLSLTGTSEEISPTASLNDPAVRSAIAKARGSDVCDQPLTAPKDGDPPMEQLSRALVSCIFSTQ